LALNQIAHTQQQHFEAALRLEAIIKSATDGIIIIDEHGLMELVNEAACQLFGFSEDEMVGQNVNMLMPSPYHKEHDGYLNNYLHTGVKKIIGIGREVSGQRKNGSKFPLRLSISEVVLPNRRVFTGIVQDLSKEKAAEQALRQEKERAQMYFDLANTINVVLDKNGMVIQLNKIGESLLGRTEAELAELNWFEQVVNPDQQKKIKAIFQQLMEGNIETLDYLEYSIVTRNNVTRLVAWRSALIRDEQQQVVSALSSGIDITEQRAAETRILEMNQELEKRVEQRTEELATAVNQLLKINKKLEVEIQERKAVETALRHSESELRKAYEIEKELSTLKSRFVSMASHEFRTPLSTILSSADLIEAYTSELQHEKRLKHTARIKSAVSNLTNILNDFLSLSKLEEGKVQTQYSEFNLFHFCEEVMDEMHSLLKPGQELRHMSNVGSETTIFMDDRLLKNILFNLVSNAIKYSEPGKPIDCELRVEQENLYITIRDQGIGIPDEDQRHLFSRFFRAHNVENIQGTGLGLHIVKRYIDLLKGHINFSSKLGEGSSFFIEIPLQRESN
jgi:PAS domain S-box-containing protein